MLKPLSLVTVLLVATSLFFAGLIAKELTSTHRLPKPRAQAANGPPSPAASPAVAPDPPAGGYAVVVSKNLFSPTRTDAPPAPPVQVGVPAPPPAALPKPFLFGVVLQQGTPVAYLQDPATKRVARYRVGDAVAGGKLQAINADNVVLSRPDGQISVRLHDPTRPKAAPPTPPAASGTQPATPTPAGTPGAAPTVAPATQPPQAVVPPPVSHGIFGRRTLPPNILGRVPPDRVPPGTDAPAPQQ